MADDSDLEIDIHGEEQTLALGRLLGRLVRPGDLIGLLGNLGAGKTVLVRGLAEGLGADPERVRSPSFTLLVTYDHGRLPLHHLDLFRLQPTEDDRLALREVLFGEGVAAIEWYEHLGEGLEHLEIEIRSPSGNRGAATSGLLASDERRIRLSACGDRYCPLIEAVRSAWA